MTSAVPKVDLDHIYWQIEQLFGQRSYAECFYASERVLSLLPHQPRFQLLKCMSLFGLGRHDEAESLLKSLLDGHSKDFKFLEAAGNYSVHCAPLSTSLMIYDKAILQFPDAGNDARYSALYRRALEQTSSVPFPLGRHARFRALYEQVLATNGLEGAIAECGCFRIGRAHV